MTSTIEKTEISNCFNIAEAKNATSDKSTNYGVLGHTSFHSLSYFSNVFNNNIDLSNGAKMSLNPLAKSFAPKSNGSHLLSSENCFNLVETSLARPPFKSFSLQFYAYVLFSVVLALLIFSTYFKPYDNKTPHHLLQSLRLKNKDKIIIGHLNINSIRHKLNLLKDMCQNRIDILLVSETKIDSSFPDAQFSISGFSQPKRLDRNRNGGGLLLYVREDIPTKVLSLEGDIECILTDVTIAKKKWLIFGIYNPHKHMIKDFLSMLEKNVCKYLPLYDNMIILGDFNCEVDEEPMSDFCNTYNLKSLIKFPTCFKSSTNPSCIDLILTNRNNCFQNSTVIETGLSDFHSLIATVLKSTFRKKPPKILKYRDFKHYNHFSFREDCLLNLSLYDQSSISNDEYVHILTSILSLHAPIKTKYLRGNEQPFMNKALRKEHMKRTQLLNKYRKYDSEENRIAYKKQRNLCSNLLKRTKKSYFGKLKSSDVSDSKKFWKTVKPLFSDKQISSENITLVENNEIVSQDDKLAEMFNSFFSNAVKDLNINYVKHFSSNESFVDDLGYHEDPVYKAIEKYNQHPSILKIKESFQIESKFSFKSVDKTAVINGIARLKESKSAPLDSIPVRILKDHFDIIAPKIVVDFNNSIETGIFPENQKWADVSPIFKKGDKCCKTNYRPVSLLSPLSKIFERIMLDQMNHYFLNILSIYLCGFRKGMSTQTCLIYLVEKWKRSLDRSGKCGVLLTDLSKAFDCLLHDLLIAKLEAYGFEHKALYLIFNYLSNRLQRVKINSSYSSWKGIKTGVPQGSILGPTLYNLNSNDVFLFLLLEIANFADDNSPFAIEASIPKVLYQLEHESKTLLTWINNNGLKANPDKFHLLLSDQDESLSICVGNYDIKNSKSQKLLGLTFDNKLTFKDHVSDLCRKASQKIHALSRVYKFMKITQRKVLMKSFVLSHFGYCPLVWMFCGRSLNNRINRIHERGLRMVYDDYTSTFESLLGRDQSFTIHETNIQTLAIELYKTVNNLSPDLMKRVFPVNSNPRYPSQNTFLTRNNKTVSWGIESLSNIGPLIWANIPKEMKSFSLSIFKSKIRKWKPTHCPCRICKRYIPNLGYASISSQ